jgi:hypothetical protein
MIVFQNIEQYLCKLFKAEKFGKTWSVLFPDDIILWKLSHRILGMFEIEKRYRVV